MRVDWDQKNQGIKQINIVKDCGPWYIVLFAHHAAGSRKSKWRSTSTVRTDICANAGKSLFVMFQTSVAATAWIVLAFIRITRLIERMNRSVDRYLEQFEWGYPFAGKWDNDSAYIERTVKQLKAAVDQKASERYTDPLSCKTPKPQVRKRHFLGI